MYAVIFYKQAVDKQLSLKMKFVKQLLGLNHSLEYILIINLNFVWLTYLSLKKILQNVCIHLIIPYKLQL